MHNNIAGKGEIEGHAVNLENSLVGQIYPIKTHAYYNATCNMGSFLHRNFSLHNISQISVLIHHSFLHLPTCPIKTMFKFSLSSSVLGGGCCKAAAAACLDSDLPGFFSDRFGDGCFFPLLLDTEGVVPVVKELWLPDSLFDDFESVWLITLLVFDSCWTVFFAFAGTWPSATPTWGISAESAISSHESTVLSCTSSPAVTELWPLPPTALVFNFVTCCCGGCGCHDNCWSGCSWGWGPGLCCLWVEEEEGTDEDGVAVGTAWGW